MLKTVWKIEPLARPSPAHAADAVEIVGGEAVRRVVLGQVDYDVYIAHKAGIHPEGLSPDVVAAALNRLVIAGLLPPESHHVLQ